MKLSSLYLHRQIYRWVSSISSAKQISGVHRSNPKPSTQEQEIVPKIQSLKDMLCPDTLIKDLESTTEVNSAVNIFNWASIQRRFVHNADTYSSIILKLGFNGFVEEMEGFCKELIKDKCPDGERALVAVIGRFVEQCRLVEANRVLAAMVSGGLKPKVDTVNALMGALVNEKRELVDVVFVYKEMVKAGSLPNVDTLNYLIRALCDSDRVDLALDQYRRMVKKGLVPDCATYRILICHFVEKGMVDDSILILNEMVISGCGVDFAFCAIVVPLFAKLGKVDEAMLVFRKTRECNIQLDLGIYEVLISSLVENLLLDDASALSHEMVERGMPLAENVAVDIVNGFCDSGRFNDASKFVEENSLIDVSVHNALLQRYCNAEELHDAVCQFDSMFQRHIVDDNSWNILVRLLANMGITKKANEVICRMIISSFEPNSATYSSLIIGNCRSLRFREAYNIFVRMRENNWVMDWTSYAVLIEGLCHGEMMFEATDVFHYMSEARCALESSSLNHLVSTLCAKSKLEEAVKLRISSYYSGTRWTSAAYDTIMLVMLKQNKASEILNIFSMMLVDGISPSFEAHHILLNTTILRYRPEKSTWYFTRLVDAGLIPDLDTLNKLISHLVIHGQLHTISGVIYRIVLIGDFLDSCTFNMLIRGLLKEGYKDNASLLLDVMLEKGWVPDAQTHAMMLGSDANQEGHEKTEICANSLVQDNVNSILLDSLV